MRIYYSILEKDPDLKEKYGPISEGYDMHCTLVNAAEHYHCEVDGWQLTWPVTIVLFGEDGEELPRASVNLEFRPVYFVKEVG